MELYFRSSEFCCYFWEWGEVSEEWSGPVPVRSCAIGLDAACSSASLIGERLTCMGHFSEVPMLYLPTDSTIADPRLAGISKCMGLGACFDPHASQPSFSCGLVSDATLTRREGREPDRNSSESRAESLADAGVGRLEL